MTSSPTTSKRLTSNNQYYGIPQSNPDTQEPDKEFNGPHKAYISKDLLERKKDNGETKTPYAGKFEFNPESRRPETTPADPKGSRSNTMKLNGGTSEEYRDNKEVPEQDKYKPKVTIGDNFRESDQLIKIDPHFHDEGKWGNDKNGALADYTVGLQSKGRAGYEFNKDNVRLTASGEVFYGFEGNVEGHMTMGPVKQTTSAELKVGVGANGKADLVIDPRQGAAVEIQGEVFAGAELILEQKTQFGDSAEVGGRVDLKAWIGGELKGDAEIGYDNIGVVCQLVQRLA